MDEFNRTVQHARATPVFSWTQDRSDRFVCTLRCLGREAAGAGQSKRRSKAAAVDGWLAQRSPDLSFDRWVERLRQARPACIHVVDGDNSWNMVSSVVPTAQALYIVGSRTFPHEAPALPAPGASCCLERCAGVGKDAADMLAAFRLGQLVERLDCPEIIIVSKDGAFDMLRRCVIEQGVRATLVQHPAELPEELPEERTEGRTPEEEAHRRNRALVARYGRLPSYSVWDAQSVGAPESWPQWRVE
jgi:hypothetical protein